MYVHIKFLVCAALINLEPQKDLVKPHIQLFRTSTDLLSSCQHEDISVSDSTGIDCASSRLWDTLDS